MVTILKIYKIYEFDKKIDIEKLSNEVRDISQIVLSNEKDLQKKFPNFNILLNQLIFDQTCCPNCDGMLGEFLEDERERNILWKYCKNCLN